MAEMFIIILVYLRLIIKKQRYLKNKKRKLNEIDKRVKEDMKTRLR
jgi:hypothetical protein